MNGAARLTTEKKCRHCKRKPACRSRGLCWTCFYDRKIRDQYPTQKYRGRIGTIYRGPTEEQAELAKVPPEPTLAVPGSAEKIEVMQGRVDRGQPVCVKGDATFDLGLKLADLFGTEEAEHEL